MIIKFPRHGRRQVLTQQRLRNYLEVLEMLRREERSLLSALESGAVVEPGPYAAMVVKAIVREPVANPQQLVIWEVT